jgi:hypothetical protein
MVLNPPDDTPTYATASDRSSSGLPLAPLCDIWAPPIVAEMRAARTAEEPEMTMEDVHLFLELMDCNGVEVWLDGGWAVDACLGAPTRPTPTSTVIVVAEDERGIYGPPENGVTYPAGSLTGTGRLAGRSVRCISPEGLVAFHTGDEVDAQD